MGGNFLLTAELQGREGLSAQLLGESAFLEAVFHDPRRGRAVRRAKRMEKQCQQK